MLNPILFSTAETKRTNKICAVFYAHKVSCNTNKTTPSKTKKLPFSLAAMKFCNSILRVTPAVPTETFLRLRINTFFNGKSFRFFTSPASSLTLEQKSKIERRSLVTSAPSSTSEISFNKVLMLKIRESFCLARKHLIPSNLALAVWSDDAGKRENALVLFSCPLAITYVCNILLFPYAVGNTISTS